MSRRLSVPRSSRRSLLACLATLAVAACAPEGSTGPSVSLAVPASPAATLLTGCYVTRAGKPDLIVSAIRSTGPAYRRANGTRGVPVSFDVKNVGQQCAGVFQVNAFATYAKWGATEFLSGFAPAESADIDANAFTRQQLHPGTMITVSGVVNFASYHATGEQVAVLLLADGCGSEEFMPDYCRVSESSETNNKSAKITLTLP